MTESGGLRSAAMANSPTGMGGLPGDLGCPPERLGCGPAPGFDRSLAQAALGPGAAALAETTRGGAGSASSNESSFAGSSHSATAPHPFGLGGGAVGVGGVSSNDSSFAGSFGQRLARVVGSCRPPLRPPPTHAGDGGTRVRGCFWLFAPRRPAAGFTRGQEPGGCGSGLFCAGGKGGKGKGVSSSANPTTRALGAEGVRS